MGDDTIAAIASPRGIGAIAVVRISGKDSFQVARKLISSLPEDIIPRKMYHGFFGDPQHQNYIDEVLSCFMKSPFSYTGEDMVEIYCHGGLMPPQAILKQLIAHGLRQAQAGEFTRRALNNGKIDLVQAEYIQQMAHVSSEKELELSLKNVQGYLSHEIQVFLDSIKDYLIWAEAVISFPDHIEENRSVFPLLDVWQESIATFLEQHQKSRLLEQGFHIAIVGKTNVGKSTLFNTFSEKARSLVSPYASTTHDYIEELVLWNGYPIHLYDTAGWVECPNPVDQLCMEQTEDITRRSSLILIIADLSDPISMDPTFIQSLLQRFPQKAWIVLNKSDLNEQVSSQWKSQIPSHVPIHIISTVDRKGLERLKENILKFLPLKQLDDLKCLVNERWYSAFVLVKENLDHIRSINQPDLYIDMIVPELKQIHLLLTEQLGYNLNKELYREIFHKFCIGK